MKDILKSLPVKIFLLVILILFLIAVFTMNSNSTFFSSLINNSTYSMSSVSAAASKNITDHKSYDELVKENDKLTKQNQKMRNQLIDYEKLKEENQKLWKFYDLKKTYPQYIIIPALVLKRDTNSDFYSFTIDKGKSSTVKVNDPVVTENGIVGWISEVDENTARVVTVLSPQTSVAAKDNKTSDMGIVTGNAELSDKNYTAFTKLPKNHKVKKGDMIISTGASGIYPKDLALGEVVDIKYDSFDSSFYAVIEPFDTIKKLTQVAVITSFTGQGEILIPEGND